MPQLTDIPDVGYILCHNELPITFEAIFDRVNVYSKGVPLVYLLNTRQWQF